MDYMYVVFVGVELFVGWSFAGDMEFQDWGLEEGVRHDSRLRRIKDFAVKDITKGF